MLKIKNNNVIIKNNKNKTEESFQPFSRQHENFNKNGTTPFKIMQTSFQTYA